MPHLLWVIPLIQTFYHKMNHIAKFNASGVIKLYRITNNSKQLILTRNNEVIANAASIVTQIVSGNTAAVLKKIIAYDGLTVMASTSFSDVDIETSPDKVIFSALFSEASYNGHIDTLKLGPEDTDTLGFFAEATGLDIDKASNQLLAVEWAITFELPS